MNKSEITDLLNSDGNTLYKRADEIRKRYKGDGVHLRGLIEFSNICKRNCAYCGLQAKNRQIERYRIEPDEIINLAKKGVELGFKTIVLQSGEDDFYTTDKICNIVSEIKKLGVAVTLSIGEKTTEEFKAFKDAGCDRYLLRIETTDEILYEKLHPNASFKNRMRCLEDLKTLGFETGTGSLVGLPNQTVDSLANDILFFKKLNADMIGIGPFIPHENTPLRGEINRGNFDMALKMMAITRLILPDINIPATTAMETINKNGRIIALNSGANVVMANITTKDFARNYEIYPNKASLDNLETLNEKLKSIGRYKSSSPGFRGD